MSQMVTRKSTVGDEKSTRQTDSPVKDMKKKVAANAEKEKQTSDKPAEKPTEKKDKPADKPERKDKPTDKVDKKDKPAEKSTEKKDKPQEKTDKKDKPAEKVADKKEKSLDKSMEKKASEKKDDAEKAKEADKVEKNGKPEKVETPKHQEIPKQNGQSLNGNATNGQDTNGSVSSDEEDLLVIEEQDEVFPELTYDDDDEGFEPPTPESLSRSYTRRSQVKSTRTPETPRPASEKQPTEPTDQEQDEVFPELTYDDDDEGFEPPTPESLSSSYTRRSQVSSKTPEQQVPDAHVQACTDDPKDAKEKDKILKLKEDAPSDRKLRSSDVTHEGDKETDEKSAEDVVVVIEDEDGDRRKPDTNYSKSRVKVSPYRRSVRLDQTNTSLQANYTGNNTTMEMDITESSISDPPLDDSSYLSGLRNIKGRRSYKPLKEMTFRKIVNTSNISNVTLSEQGRPTVTVVGRKRKPDSELGSTEQPAESARHHAAGGKRPRLIDRISLPFRRALPQTAPEIVGINTDLPLTSPSTFEPESLKNMPAATHTAATPDKRCIVM